MKTIIASAFAACVAMLMLVGTAMAAPLVSSSGWETIEKTPDDYNSHLSDVLKIPCDPLFSSNGRKTIKETDDYRNSQPGDGLKIPCDILKK